MRDRALVYANDAREAIDLLLGEVEELRQENEGLKALIEALTSERDQLADRLTDAELEIERLKSMAFDEVVREVATERMS